MQFTQRTVAILADSTAEAQEGTYRHVFYCLPNYWMPEEEQSSSPPDTPIPILLGKDNTHLLHQPSDIHVHIPRAFGIRDMDTSTHKTAFSVLRMILINVNIDQENFLYENGGSSILCLYCVPMS